VRTDKQGVSGDEQHFEKFFPELVRALFPLSYLTAQDFCATLSQEDRAEIRRVLDVAAGTGAWSLPLAQSIPEVKVTAIDFPLVLQVTREYAERLGVIDQYELRPGNIREIDLGSEEFDLVIVGNICHSEGERNTKALLKKCYSAIRKGGRLLIADVVPNDERTGPLLALMFGVNMLLNTVEGDVFTFAEFDGWLKGLGFRSVEAVRVGGDSPLILARK
jgi:ubiquinone/menaquinone biosynthesis C-methylase UbiE